MDPPQPPDPPPELDEQYQELLDTVWHAEAGWRFDDWLDQAVKR